MESSCSNIGPLSKVSSIVEFKSTVKLESSPASKIRLQASHKVCSSFETAAEDEARLASHSLVISARRAKRLLLEERLRSHSLVISAKRLVLEERLASTSF